jgi:predicted nucleic acid-binding protein
MILVDTSIWIALLTGWAKRPNLLLFITCGPIMQEVLQGLRPGRASEAFREGFLALPRLCDPVALDLYLEAAEIYREGRARGYTIRSSTDCLIAAIAIQNRVPVWHRDRDFTALARYTRLRTIEGAAV